MAKKSQKFTDRLRAEIQRAPMSRYKISEVTGVPESSISRFLSGKVGLSLRSVELICECLQLELVCNRPRTARKKSERSNNPKKSSKER